MKILIVEDEIAILKKLQLSCENEGYQVKTATSLSALEQALNNKKFYPNVIILDRLLGGEDSAKFISKIKSTLADTKILILSAIDTATEKATLLDSGVDDYLAKPYSTIELLARIKALARRSSLITSEQEHSIANLAINQGDRSVKASGQFLNLSQKEYQLLILFTSNPGKIFPKNTLLEQIWRNSGENESNVVEATVNNLRRKLEHAGANVQLRNMRNVGYWLEA